jgi:hypothetical protein
MKTTQQEVKSMLASLDSVRFREISTNLLYDCKMMDTGVIVRQCHPYDMNINFIDFDEFTERFEISYVPN